jgi:hypothetical protein
LMYQLYGGGKQGELSCGFAYMFAKATNE